MEKQEATNSAALASGVSGKDERAANDARPPGHGLHWEYVLIAVLAVLFVGVWQGPPSHAFEGVASYTWLHTFLETLSIVVAWMVFGVAWNAYSRERAGNILVLAIGLMVTGVIDMAHTLSFKGMPDFFTPSDPEKAINFWLAARACFALTLTTVALRRWTPLARPRVRHLAAACGLAVAAFVVWAGVLHQHTLPRTFIAGQGLTPLKIATEYLIIGMLALPALIFLRDARRGAQYEARTLFAAAAISILAELCFTLYSDVTDIFNLLGHVYKAIAYGMIYRAVFVTSVREPFERVVAAEARMRASSNYVRGVIEASIDPLFMVSPDGRISDVNEAAVQATGLARNVLIGSRFSTHFTDPASAEAACSQVADKGVLRDCSLSIRHSAGGVTEVLFNAAVCRDEAGEMEGILATARDMTEVRQAQAALKRQHDLLTKITETSPIGITVWDLEGHITFANRQAQGLLGPARAEIGRLHYNSPDWQITDFEGNPLPDSALPFHRVRASGTPVYNVPMSIAGENAGRSLLSVNAAPLIGGTGAVEGVVATLEDLTRRKEAEARLAASEALLQTALDASRMGTWSWDMASNIVTCSRQFSRLMGLDDTEATRGFDEIMAVIHPDDRMTVQRALDDGSTRTTGEWVDFRVCWPDGGIHWISARGSVERHTDGSVATTAGLAMDITDEKENALALARVNRALRTLSAGNECLVHAQDEASLLHDVCRIVVTVGGYCMAWVAQAVEDADKSVACLASYGDAANFLAGAGIVWSDTTRGNGPTGTALRTGRTQVNQNHATNPNMAPWREELLRLGLQASVAIPLRDDAGERTALVIYAGEPDAFTHDELKLLQEMAADLAFGVATLRTRAAHESMLSAQQNFEARLRESLVESIQAIATTLELRDPYTAGHQRRVARLCEAIGKELGLPPMQLQGLHLAASIHDVGKIQIPGEILNKPGRLSGIELELIRTHAGAGFDILKDIRFPWPIARIVRQHHEHIDGSGYPDRLAGDAILLESRILTVADVVEAMTSHRPYRPGLGLEAALAHISEYRGRWFDPAVVDACLALFREGRYAFDEQRSAGADGTWSNGRTAAALVG